RTRELESVTQYTVHAMARHHGFLDHDLARCAGVHAPAHAAVLALGVLAHDDHVDLAGLTRRAIAADHRCGDPGHEARGAQVDVLIELAAEHEQRAPQRDVIGHLVGPAHGAEVDGVVAADLLLPVVGQHLPVLFEVIAAAEVEMIEL